MNRKYTSYFSILSLTLFITSLVLYCGCSSDNYEKKQLAKGELFFDKNIPQDKVESLASFINQCAIFNDEVHKARLTKTDSSYELSLSVPPEMIKSEQYQNYTEILAIQLSDDVFDHTKLLIHLTDDKFNPKVTKTSK